MKLRAQFALLSLTTLLAACGGGHSGDDSAPTPAQAATPAVHAAAVAAAAAAPALASTTTARYVRLESLSEINGGTSTTMAEFNVLGASSTNLPRTAWKVSASSAETAYPASYAVDGSKSTYWSSQFRTIVVKLPHTYTVDLGAATPITGFVYQPRSGGGSTGTIKDWRFHTSGDGVTWVVAAQGTFVADTTAKTVKLSTSGTNHVPTLGTVSAQTAVVGQAYSLALTGADVDGDPLTYSASGLPAGLSLGAGSGLISGKPTTAGTFTVSATVADGRGGTASVTFAFTVTAAAPQPPAPGTISALYVRLEALSEINGGPWTTMSEFNLLGTGGAVLGRTGWTASADSQETAGENGLATNAIDGDAGTHWHTQWTGTTAPLPHTYTVKLGTTPVTITGFKYRPRTDGDSNGTIKDWRFYTSTNGTAWTLAGAGSFAADSTEKTVLLTAVAPVQNPVQTENARSAADGVTSAWTIPDALYASQHEIEGYASLNSVNRGGSLKLFVNVKNPAADPNYTIDVYRMGWYGGAGGRRIVPTITRTSRTQPACPVVDTATRLVECNWLDAYTLAIPTSADPTVAMSGVYLAKLTASGSGKSSYIIFVVRDDSRTADFMFQTSVTTYAAYNRFGGYSVYTPTPAYKVSFNRPYDNVTWGATGTRYLKGAGDFLEWEVHAVHFMERNGYNVVYSTSIDTHRSPERLKQFRAFLSVGHDEYWTRGIYDAIENARNVGVNLAFLGANTAYWSVRLEPSAQGDADRRIVAYRYDAPALDPLFNTVDANALWRDPPLNRPEAGLVGVQFDFNTVDLDMVVSDCSSWICTGTGLKAGDRLPGLLGYEVDAVYPASPAGLTVLTRSPYVVNGATRYSSASYYTHSSGAGVFASGSMQWNWGLDAFPPFPARASAGAQGITKNVLDRFLVLPVR